MSGGGSRGGGSSTVQQVSRFEPPGYIADILGRYAPRAESTYFPGGQLIPYPFPGQTIAPFQPLQQAGFRAIEQLGPTSPYIQQAIASRQNILSQNAIQNPLLGQYFKEASAEGLGQLRGSALRGGGFGSSGAQEAEGRYLSNLAANIYTPAWQEQERLREQAAFGAPQLQMGAYGPARMFLEAGGMQQQQEQTFRDIQFENMMRQAGWPFQALEMFGLPLQIAYGAGGGTTVSQIPTRGPFGPWRL